MDFTEAVRKRRMVRSFACQPLPEGLARRLLEASLRAPTAGNAMGTAWILLEGTEATRRYWDATTSPEWRAASRRWEGLSRAPAVAVSVCSPHVYVERYGEPDKVRSGLGLAERSGHGDGGGYAPESVEAVEAVAASWPVPYWHGDAGFAVMTLLLGATDAGLGACFLGNFRGEEALAAALSLPPGWRVFGAVALGYPDGGDHRSTSLTRPGPSAQARVHSGHWQSQPDS